MRRETREAPTKREEPTWWAPFLGALGGSAVVLLACRTAGVSRATAYRHRARSERFARRWDDAIEDAVDLLEAEARRRAVAGVEKPVYYRGQVVGNVREYSDTLLIFLLKALHPQKYRERFEVKRLIEAPSVHADGKLDYGQGG
jgi:hypothetical protein